MTVLDYRSGIDERAAAQPRVRDWLGWAVYLGMSWTWCIGMFLPVLLIRDYGGWAWVVFAVPNVVGAAAMGWTTDAASSAKLVAQHRVAVEFFSFITSSFQIFFAIWMFQIERAPGGSAWIMLALAVVIYLASRAGSRVAIAIAVAVLLVSLVCVISVDDWPHRVFTEKFPRALSALAPVCIFGFLFCPYLDGTFHVARQSAKPDAGRDAFFAGFGIFFLAMIAFTLIYADYVIRWMEVGSTARGILAVIGVHWLFQLAFTTGIHWERIGWWKALLTVITGGLLGFATTIIHRPGITSGELIYRLFMAFYGLVFPTYVWLCMIPTWREPAGPSQRSLAVFAGSVLLATPFYWMGFIEQRMFWLLPGLGIVLLARLLVPGQRTVPPSPATA